MDIRVQRVAKCGSIHFKARQKYTLNIICNRTTGNWQNNGDNVHIKYNAETLHEAFPQFLYEHILDIDQEGELETLYKKLNECLFRAVRELLTT